MPSKGYFAKLTKRRLQRGVFCSVVELQAAIKRFLAETNADPRPFRWTKDPAKIIAAVKRGHQVLNLSTSFDVLGRRRLFSTVPTESDF